MSTQTESRRDPFIWFIALCILAAMTWNIISAYRAWRAADDLDMAAHCAALLREDLPSWAAGTPDPRKPRPGDVLRRTRRCESGWFWGSAR